MDLRKLKKLIDLVQESGIGEIEITEGEEKVRITRQSAAAPMLMAAPQMQPMAMQGMAAPAAAAPAPAAPAPPPEPKGHALKSPMVGTFYRAPPPGRRPSSKSARRCPRARPCASSRP
jgi:acetyl-CoA carboxylase biotin carboxyl carrier protein